MAFLNRQRRIVLVFVSLDVAFWFEFSGFGNP
jgi:hypothetical protein